MTFVLLFGPSEYGLININIWSPTYPHGICRPLEGWQQKWWETGSISTQHTPNLSETCSAYTLPSHLVFFMSSLQELFKLWRRNATPQNFPGKKWVPVFRTPWHGTATALDQLVFPKSGLNGKKRERNQHTLITSS